MPTFPTKTRYNVRYFAFGSHSARTDIRTAFSLIQTLIPKLPLRINEQYILREVKKISDTECTLQISVIQDFDEPSKCIDLPTGEIEIRDIFQEDEDGSIIHPTFVHVRIQDEDFDFGFRGDYKGCGLIGVGQKFARIGENGLETILSSLADMINETDSNILTVKASQLILQGGTQFLQNYSAHGKKLLLKIEKKGYEKLKGIIGASLLASTDQGMKDFIAECEAMNANSKEVIYSVGRETSSNLQGDKLFSLMNSALRIVHLQQEQDIRAISKCELYYYDTEAMESRNIDLIKNVIRDDIFIDQVEKKASIPAGIAEIKRVFYTRSADFTNAMQVLRNADF